MQSQVFHTLNQMARAKGLPSYEQFHRETGVVGKSRPDQSDMGAKRFLAGDAAPQARDFLSEPDAPIQGAQQPVSYVQLLKARIQQSSEPRQDFTAKKRPGTLQSSADKPFQHKPGASQLQQIVQQAFVDPRPGKSDILQQARQGRVAGHRMAQVELNLARIKAQGQITPEQQAHLEIGAKALFSANWLRHDGQDVGNGYITYRRITVERSLAPMLAYADAEQYWRQNTHLSPKQDWMGQLQKTATGLLKGLANGIVAGAGPNASRGEEGAYAVGDVLGAIGVNVAALFAGPLAPAVWVGYGLAREANREVDAGKPLNPVAIAASGAISAIPGTTAIRVPFGVAGRIGAGMAAGYASDLANRGVQQLGDTGRIDARQLDYTPGLGTVMGGTVGLLSHPGVSQAFQKYLLGRQAQLRNGEKVPVSYEDFVVQFKREYNFTDADIGYYENRFTTPPANHPFNRPIWSDGPINNSLLNAYNHSVEHADTYNLSPGDSRYVQKVHDLLDNMPQNTELMETKTGMKRYYSPNAGPEGQTIFTVQEPSGAPRSSYTPDGTPQEQYDYFRRQGGKYKGKLK